MNKSAAEAKAAKAEAKAKAKEAKARDKAKAKAKAKDKAKTKEAKQIVDQAIKENLLGSRVRVTWIDSCGFINADLDEVALAECKSEGVVSVLDDEMIVLRSSIYTNSETGDYTALPIGCITGVEVL